MGISCIVQRGITGYYQYSEVGICCIIVQQGITGYNLATGLYKVDLFGFTLLCSHRHNLHQALTHPHTFNSTLFRYYVVAKVKPPLQPQSMKSDKKKAIFCLVLEMTPTSKRKCD